MESRREGNERAKACAEAKAKTQFLGAVVGLVVVVDLATFESTTSVDP